MKLLTFDRLSAIVAAVATGIRGGFGLTRLALGGGSAPALLDHLFTGVALCMRDLDLILVADRPVDGELAQRIGEALDAPELRFLPQYVYPRRRARGGPTLWTAGWGVLWDSHGLEVDLSIFHDETALAHNGLLNVDRILVPLPPGRALDDLAAAMLALGSPAAALAAGLVVDPFAGHVSWTTRAPQIVGSHAIQAAPIECALRIVRTCVHKLRLSQLDPALADPLRAAIHEGPERGDRYVRVRCFLKLLHDARAGQELAILRELGVFARWLPDLHEALVRQAGSCDVGERAAPAVRGEHGDETDAAARLAALLRHMPPAGRERVLAEVAVAEPGFAELVRHQRPPTACRTAPRPVVRA